MINSSNQSLTILDKIYVKSSLSKNMKEKEDIPKWTNFICPSCAVAYGVSVLVKAIRKRKEQKSFKTFDV